MTKRQVGSNREQKASELVKMYKEAKKFGGPSVKCRTRRRTAPATDQQQLRHFRNRGGIKQNTATTRFAKLPALRAPLRISFRRTSLRSTDSTRCAGRRHACHSWTRNLKPCRFIKGSVTLRTVEKQGNTPCVFTVDESRICVRNSGRRKFGMSRFLTPRDPSSPAALILLASETSNADPRIPGPMNKSVDSRPDVNTPIGSVKQVLQLASLYQKITWDGPFVSRGCPGKEGVRG